MRRLSLSLLSLAPIPFDVTWEDGTTAVYCLPYVGTADFLPWLADLTEKRRKAARSVVAADGGLSAPDRMRVKISIERDEAVITDLNAPICTPAGIRRVLELSVAKSDCPAELRAKLVDSICRVTWLAFELAQRLSTLFSFDDAGTPPPDPETAGDVAFQQAPGTKPAKGGLENPLAGGGPTPTAEDGSGTTTSPGA